MGSLDILYAGTLPPHQGGSAISAAVILRGLAALGHRIRAVAPITADGSTEGEAFARAHPELSITRFPVPFFENSPDVPPPADYREREGAFVRQHLSELIATRRPDVLFIGRESFAWHVPPLASAHQIPCVVRMAGTTTIGILKGGFPGDQSRLLLARLNQADRLIAQTPHMADSLRRLGLEHVNTIPNSVDVRAFSPAPKDQDLLRSLDIPRDAIVAMHASNLKALKRAMDVITSAARVMKRHNNLMYVVVGDGARRAPMEAACRELGIIDRVRFVGWIDYEQMPRYLNIADIVVMPSEAEAQARVYLEAQACGKVLIASDIPGAREVITDGVTGLLFRVGDVDDLSEHTLRAAADSDMRARIGHQALARVRVHDIDVVAPAWAGALAGVIHSKGR